MTFVILSFEGPDPYSHIGGLGTRVTGLAEALAGLGIETHLFFIGDPDKPGHEAVSGGKLHLHRWCQWISRHHPYGCYDGEEGKLYDWTRSIPAWLETELLAPKIEGGEQVVVIGEEWQTTGSIIALGEVVHRRGWQGRVSLLWNANNTYSFHRIDWKGLERASTLTTVSRYMKHVMWDAGIDTRVIPNGIPESWLEPVDLQSKLRLTAMLHDRVSLAKVARWHPDKRWDMAVGAVAELKRFGYKPLLLARGSNDAAGADIVRRARGNGLKVATVAWSGSDVASLAGAVQPALAADMVVLDSYMTEPQRRALFMAADAVLANSGIEPFGLVGLETMAVGGIAFVGATGEDYATPGYDAVSLQTDDPSEIVHHVAHLHTHPEESLRMRDAARDTAQRYTWQSVIKRVMLPSLRELGVHLTLESKETPRRKLPLDLDLGNRPDGQPGPGATPQAASDKGPRPSVVV